MQPARQKHIARLVLSLFVLAGLAWLARLDYSRKISTDVMDLIPVGEQAPEVAMVRTLAGERQSRVVLFALSIPPRAGEETGLHAQRKDKAAEVFVRSLVQSGCFSEVSLAADTSSRDELGSHVFRNRFDLLLPSWLASRKSAYESSGSKESWSAWLAERTALELEAYLSKPEAMAFQGLIPQDPLLLLPAFAESAQAVATSSVAAGPEGQLLVWAMTVEAPLNVKGQKPVFNAVEAALAAVRSEDAGATLQWLAVSRFAARSRQQIEAEMSGLNLLSLAAVLAVAAIAVRRVHKVLHLAPVILCSLLGAWVATTVLFERVHVLVFVVGSLLGGVAVDYGFYLFLQPPRYPDETYREKVARLLKPLLASALTTILGFSLLFFSELPMIRHLGVFVSAGLLSALAASLLWFAQVDDMFLETRAFIRPKGRGLHVGFSRGLLFLGLLIALSGPWWLSWRDDIRSLEIPSPELMREAVAVRAMFGEAQGRKLYLTRGNDPAEARAALERFQNWHKKAFPEASFASLGLALPTPEEWLSQAGRFDALHDFAGMFRDALGRHGFDPEGFAPFFEAWSNHRATKVRPSLDTLTQELNGVLRGPLSLMMGMEPGSCWFATISSQSSGVDLPPELGTVSAAQLESLNRLFKRYRVSALRLSAIGLSLVGLSVFVLYGLRRGIRIFALPAGSCLFAFGVFGFMGQTMNMFHLLGAFLGVCLSHNYAIFSAENAARGEPPPPSIRLSALTTAASFGVLALSKIPVVSALGSMVSLIVITALIAVEMEPFSRTGKP